MIYLDVALFSRDLLKKDEPKAKSPFGHECQMKSILVQYLLARIDIQSEIVGVSKRSTEVHFVVKTTDGVYIDASPDTSVDCRIKSFSPTIVLRADAAEYSLYKSMEQNARSYGWAQVEQRKSRTFWRILFDDFERIKKEYANLINAFVLQCQGNSYQDRQIQ